MPPRQSKKAGKMSVFHRFSIRIYLQKSILSGLLRGPGARLRRRPDQEEGLGQGLVPREGLFAAGVPPQDARDQGAQKLQLVDGREPHGQAGRRAGTDRRVNGLGGTLFGASCP